MVLDLDCVRDVLLTVERLSEFDSSMSYKPLSVEDIHGALPGYPLHIVYYTLLKLEDAGYIYALNGNPKKLVQQYDLRAFTVLDLTFSGSEYLNAVRSPDSWNKIKPYARDLTFEGIKFALGKLALKAIPFLTS